MIYTATISSMSLRLRESRLVADLLLRSVTGREWKAATVDDNVFQVPNPAAFQKKASILRARLEPLGRGLWEMVRDAPRREAVQAALAGTVRHSRLLGDFMDITIREQRSLFAKYLEPRLWLEYIEGCRGRDPDMPLWSDSTIHKLRAVVFSVLAEADYIESVRTPALQNVFLDERLAKYLHDRGETYVLRCLQVAE
jgi:hypothetical protein